VSRALLLVLAGLVGCAGDESCKVADQVPWYPDVDGDGYGDARGAWLTCVGPDGWVPVAGDCADTDAAAHPGATETCDGRDEDCDGGPDDGLNVFASYRDVDGDGYGDSLIAQVDCRVPEGFTELGGDCADLAATAYPGGVEVADGLDNDCDATVDEGTTVFDDDGDGFTEVDGDCDDRNGAIRPTATEDPANLTDDDCDGYVDEGGEDFDDDGDGFTESDGDCDDGHPLTYPGALEWCDGADQDCDGVIDGPDPVDGDLVYADGDGDGFGDRAVSVHACAVSDGWSEQATDCDDTQGGVYPGAIEVVDDLDNDCDGTIDDGTIAFDDDGDGYTEREGDCDDGSSVRYPGAIERCDGIDADCNGLIDDDPTGAPSWYVDADLDGHGAGSPTSACSQPADMVADNDDCDDSDARIHPDATEYCNGWDDDCDGLTDGFDAIDPGVWFSDADGDGYGDDSSLVATCDGPPGYVEAGGDCDDGDAARFPGAPEQCNASDDDCDAIVDEDPATAWYSDVDGDGFGDDSTQAYTCDPAPGSVVVGGDCDDLEPLARPDGVELCGNGIDDDCSGGAPECQLEGEFGVSDSSPVVAARLRGAAAGDQLGYWVSSAGDVNGDGKADLILGARTDATVAADAGAAFVVTAPVAGDVVVGAGLGAHLLGVDGGDYAGTSVAGVGDVDGDGFDDVVVGAQSEATSGSGAGAVYLVRGPMSGEISLSTAYATMFAAAAGDAVGLASSYVGDMDGDGYTEVVAGASGGDTAYILYGPVSGSMDLSAADVAITGAVNSALGVGLGAAGDVDGDGLADLLVGAEDYDASGRNDAGAVYLFLGPGAVGDTGDAEAEFLGAAANEKLGRALCGGDLDADGRSDVVLGAYNSDAGGSNAGRVYGFTSVAGGSYDLALGAPLVMDGESNGDYAGRSVDAGDIDGDGTADLIVGAYLDAVAGTEAGAVFVAYGPLSGIFGLDAAELRLRGEAADDRLGRHVAFAGDVDGDGAGDLILASYHNDVTGDDAGAVYLVLGHGL
jgi:hypothetical protein